DPWGGAGERPVVSPLWPCAIVCAAALSSAKPRPGSPRGRFAHSSVFRPEQSGSHRRWQPRLQSNRPALVRKLEPSRVFVLRRHKAATAIPDKKRQSVSSTSALEGPSWLNIPRRFRSPCSGVKRIIFDLQG